MADIRINSLSTTASSTASDDFIAVDGATNGTRKLNGYSPSFGGNATVGGTLTVNGTSLSTFAGNVETAGAASSDRSFGVISAGTLATAFGNNTSGSTNAYGVPTGNSYLGNAQNYGLVLSTSAVARLTIANGSNGGNVSISSTTASTTTSTGALVVGNGTSGGLGVGGTVNVGGKIAFAAQATGTTLVDFSSTDDGTILGYGGSTFLRLGGNFILQAGNEGFLRISGNSIASISATSFKLFQPLWLNNAYVAGAPTATGYIVIKDSTGTSYKIPAVAL